MERADAALLSSGPPAEGGPPAHMEQTQLKRPRPPIEAEQVRATPVAQHDPWSCRIRDRLSTFITADPRSLVWSRSLPSPLHQSSFPL
eukprot:scaffold110811_cov32-Tisochrysis_lutea.AAC.1